MDDRKWLNEHPGMVVFVAVLSAVMLLASLMVTVRDARKRASDSRPAGPKTAADVEQTRRSGNRWAARGRLIFEKIPLRAKDLSGRIHTHLLQERGRTLKCGDSLDVMWSKDAIFFMKDKGLFEQVLAASGGYFSDLKWDGRNVWVSVPEKGIWILETSGAVVAKVGSGNDLPPAEKGLLLHPVEAGRVLAAGSFGPHGRGWCAIVEFEGGQTSVNVFHEAKNVLPSAYDKQKVSRDPFAAFAPSWIRGRETEGRQILLVGRHEPRYGRKLIYPLEIDLDSLSVRISSDKVPRKERRGIELEYEGKTYLIGRVWHRIDPNTRRWERLVSRGSLPDPYGALRDYWVSAHYGLVGWLRDQLFQIRITDEEHDILAESFEGKGEYYHTFAFEDEKGPVKDYDALCLTQFRIEREGKPTLSYRYEDYMRGGYFPLGTYRAWRGYMKSGMGKIVESRWYEPIEVTEESPVRLVFKVKPIAYDKKVYFGQVVHAVTGQPMKGAFVMAGVERNLAWITPEEWQELHKLPINPSLSDEALWPVKNTSIFPVEGIARTDPNGRFQITFGPRKQVWALTAFEENYLSICCSPRLFGPVQNGRIEVPTMQLFPAAKVIIEPRGPNVMLAFVPDENENSPLANTFFRMYRGYNSRPEVCMYWVQLGLRQPYYVPAGFSFKLKFSGRRSEDRYMPDIRQTINLKQGETLDLGQCASEPTMRIFVKVVDTEGNPVKGVPLTWSGDDLYHHPPVRRTDANGLAPFKVEPNSTVRFRILRNGKRRHMLKSFAYEIGGRKEAGREFIIQVQDDIVQRFSK